MLNNAMQKKDTRYLDLMNVIACLAVVMLHTNNCFWRFSATEAYWLSANIIESIFYFAVPAFFMISGATLIDYSKRYTTREFFRKRCIKTVIPFFVWSCIGIIYAAFILNSVNLSEVGKRFFINSIMNAEIVTYYWFFPPLFCVYLSMPLLSAVEEQKRKNVFIYLAVMGYLINSVIPFFKNEVLDNKLSFPLFLYAVNENLLFAVIGYLLANYECSAKCKRAIYCGAIIALLVHIVGTYVVSMDAGASMRTFKNRFISVPYAAGIFLMVKSYGNRIMGTIWGKLVSCLKQYTFAIYLLHWFVIKTLLHFVEFDSTSLVYRLGGVFLIVPICIAITCVLRQIPLIKYVVP